jgi:hypothetical protein
MTQARRLEFDVLRQPDDTTCGPTCLQAVYRYFDDPLPLDQVIGEVKPLPGGGTLAVWLACHALRRGYDAEIFTYNLQVFDPTWFAPEVDLAARLKAQVKHKRKRKKLAIATQAYIEFLALGGTLRFEELTPSLIRRFLDHETPILTGLSATYLYGCAREHGTEYDDVRGEPMGHFVVLCGYDRAQNEVLVADPLHDNPGFNSHLYNVGMDRLIGAVLLGVVTYDANLLILRPKQTSL